MILTRRLALALCLALLSTSYSNSQDISSTSNLINYGTSPTDTTSVWNNGVYVNQLCFGAGGAGNCGPNPSVRPGGYINFSYGTADLNQVININKALESAGTGVQLAGFVYNFTAKNGNGWDNGQQDYLSAYVKLYSSAGNQLAAYDYTSSTNRKYNWTNFSFNETFATPYTAAALSSAQVGLIGRDTNFWAGNYGPEVYNVDFRLKYKIDPCALNPAYSSTCSGFNSVVNSNNLLDSTRGGTSLNQAFAINTALSSSGVGAKVHGFNYGFNYTVGESWSGCTATNQDGSCSWYMTIPGRVSATVSLTNSSNQSIYSKNYSLTGDGVSGSVSDKYLLPSSMNQSLLGSGRISGSTSGSGSRIEGMWATLIYTADPCVANPLSSPDCKGYGYAMAKQASASNSTSIVLTDGSQMQDTSNFDPIQQAGPTSGNTAQQSFGTEPLSGGQPMQGTTQTASGNPGSMSANQPSPQGSGSQTRAGEVKTASDNKAGPSLSNVMSMISSNQSRIGNEAKSVVQAAESAATKDAQQAQEQAEAVASSLTAQSVVGSMSIANESQGSANKTSSQTQASAFSLPTGVQSTALSIDAIKPPTQTTATDTTQNIGTGLTISNAQIQFTSAVFQTSYTVAAVESPLVNFGFQLPTGRASSIYEIEAPQSEGIKMGTRSTLNDVLEQQPTMMQSVTQSQQTSTVKRDVQINDLAVGVDIANIARQPAGYQAYSAAMPDVAFYAPKEIYKNQVNVDNVRLLRGLGSDRLHQEMVNQQYRLGN